MSTPRAATSAAIAVAALAAALAGPTLAADTAPAPHVPPDPPRTRVHAMTYGEMADMMGMDDRLRFAKVMLDRVEWVDAREPAFAWDAAAWYGGDMHKLWIETEGERADGVTHEVRVEALWDRAVTRWWNARAGVRHDLGIGPSRTWAAFGVAGLAPGFIDVEAAVYVGEAGRTALRVEAAFDLLFTQRLVLQPEAALDAYGQHDPQRLIGAGISEIELGLRLRYEIRRELAPYIGSTWRKRVGDTGDLARAAGEAPDDLEWCAGIRAWF